MFTIKIASQKVKIRGCPSYGIDAIDFRRQHGLPVAPSNEVEIKSFAWEDEAFCRLHKDRCDNNADIVIDRHWKGYGITLWAVNGVGEVYKTYWGEYAGFLVDPGALKAFLDYPNNGTAQGLVENYWSQEQRSKLEAEEEAAAYIAEKTAKEQAKEQARLLLKDEIGELERKIKELTKDLQAQIDDNECE